MRLGCVHLEDWAGMGLGCVQGLGWECVHLEDWAGMGLGWGWDWGVCTLRTGLGWDWGVYKDGVGSVYTLRTGLGWDWGGDGIGVCAP